MVLRTMKKAWSILPTRKLQDIQKREDGVAAIEFALVAPLMIAFYFGLSEISMAISADRGVAHATSVAGDLATQTSSLNGAQLGNVMTATLAVLGVKPSDLVSSDPTDPNATRVTIELNSYRKETDGTIVPVGYARLGPEITAGGDSAFDAAGLGSSMLSSTSGAVVARVNFKYSPVTYAFMEDVTLHETFALKPRKSLTVPFGTGTDNVFGCTANSQLLVTCTAGTVTAPS